MSSWRTGKDEGSIPRPLLAVLQIDSLLALAAARSTEIARRVFWRHGSPCGYWRAFCPFSSDRRQRRKLVSDRIGKVASPPSA